MRRNALPPKTRRRQEIAWPPKRRFGCGVGSVGLKAPSFKDTAQKRWNREAKAADRADHRWRELGEEVGVPAAWWHHCPAARIAAAAPRRRGARISKLFFGCP